MQLMSNGKRPLKYLDGYTCIIIIQHNMFRLNKSLVLYTNAENLWIGEE